MIKALVIDDSGLMRKMVIKSVTESKLGEFEFEEAGDGKEALDKITATPYDICFIDWNMPNMTGVEFVRAVRKIEKDKGEDAIPLVMVTSEKTVSKLQEALDEAGADQFISKPFTVDELKVKLKKSVEKAQFVCVRRRRKQQAASAPAPAAKPSGGLFGGLFS